MDISARWSALWANPDNVVKMVLGGFVGLCVGETLYMTYKAHKMGQERPSEASDGRLTGDNRKLVLETDPSMLKPKIALTKVNSVDDILDYTRFVNRRVVRDPDVKKALEDRYLGADGFGPEDLEYALEVSRERSEERRREEEMKRSDEGPREPRMLSRRDLTEPDHDLTLEESIQWDHDHGEEEPDDFQEMVTYLWDTYDMEWTLDKAGVASLARDDDGHVVPFLKVRLPERDLETPVWADIEGERFTLAEDYDFYGCAEDGYSQGLMYYWPLDDKLFIVDGSQPEVVTNERVKDLVRGVWERRRFDVMYVRDKFEELVYEVAIAGVGDGKPTRGLGEELYGFPGAWTLWWLEEFEDFGHYFEREDGTRGYIVKHKRGQYAGMFSDATREEMME